jgi:hypothetical protein
VFRRRRSADASQDDPRSSQQDQVEFDDEFDDEPAGAEPAGSPRAEGGPWDSAEPYPAQERVDLGSLLVPVGPEHEIQLVMAEQNPAWINVRYQESELMIQVFAVARSDSMWDDVRAEIIAEMQTAGGRSEEIQGSFGVELLAQAPVNPGQPASGVLVGFIGTDGPRWFLRGMFTGPAAAGGEQAGLLEEVFSGTVVVRGDHPVPPWEILELRLPPQAVQALEAQAAANAEEEKNRFRTDLNPFDRGPEFTETR